MNTDQTCWPFTFINIFWQNLRKPLLWERLKSQPRFKGFQDKVVHIVLDDVDALEASEGDMWGLELLQVRTRSL